MPHLLVAGRIHPEGIELLQKQRLCSYEVVDSAEPRAYLPALPKADALLLRTQPLDAQAIASAPKLRIVSRHGVGYDAVDTQALAARGICLTIVGDVNARTVAEHAFMLLLAANRRLGTNRQSATSLNWTCRDALAAHELDGKNLLIIGYGRIGKQLAAMAAPFGLRVLVYDPYLAADDLGEVERVADLNQALPRADLVSLHAPQSQGALIGARELALLPRGAVLVNTARGGLIDEQALAAALASGQIGAAGLDVLGQEPPTPDHPLLYAPNAIITPHLAGLTAECAARMARRAVQNILDYLRGELNPQFVVK